MTKRFHPFLKELLWLAIIAVPVALINTLTGGPTLDINLSDTYIVINDPFVSFWLPVMAIVVFVVWLIRIIASGKSSIFTVLIFAVSGISFILILTHAFHFLGKWQGHLDNAVLNYSTTIKGGVKTGNDYSGINTACIYTIQTFIIIALMFSVYKWSITVKKATGPKLTA